MRLRFVILACSVVAVTALASAQDNPIPVTEAEIAAPGGWGPKEGKVVELVNVKFKDYFSPNLRLVGAIDKGRLLIDADRHPDARALADSLAKNPPRTSTGTLDKKGRSNVRIVGVAHDDSQGGRTIDVTDVTRMPDDVELFKKRAEALAATDPDGKLKLADEARKRAETYSEDDLRDWARTTYDGALDLKRTTLAKGDVKAAIDLALKYRDLAGLPSKAIAFLGELVLDTSIDSSEREKAAKVLEQDLQAVLHRDHWVSKEDFKIALGYIQRRDASGAVQWVRHERLELEQSVAKQREANKNDPNLRKLLGSQYEEAANKGEPTIGMYKQELVRTKGYGFPQLVDRFTEKSPGSNNDLTWDQWVMADGSRFYFMNGILFDWKKKDVPYPKN